MKMMNKKFKYIDEERYLTAPHPAHPKFLKSNILKLANKGNGKGNANCKSKNGRKSR